MDISAECVAKAAARFPQCRFECVDVLAAGAAAALPSLTATTVVFLDIGGNRGYQSVAAALRTCLATMPALRLVVVKSRELRQLLVRFDCDALSIARNLQAPTTDVELCAALLREVRSLMVVMLLVMLLADSEIVGTQVALRGGELPLELLYTFRPRLRYHIGKKRLRAFIRTRPELEIFEAEADDSHSCWRTRFRATAPTTVGAAAAAAPATAGGTSGGDADRLGPTEAERAAAGASLSAKVAKQLEGRREEEGVELGELYARLRGRGLSAYVSASPDARAYAAAADTALNAPGAAAVLPWSGAAFHRLVALRHLRKFLLASELFEIEGDAGDAGEEPAAAELDALRVHCSPLTGTAAAMPAVPVVAAAAAAADEAGGGAGTRECVIEVVDAAWVQAIEAGAAGDVEASAGADGDGEQQLPSEGVELFTQLRAVVALQSASATTEC